MMKGGPYLGQALRCAVLVAEGKEQGSWQMQGTALKLWVRHIHFHAIGQRKSHGQAQCQRGRHAAPPLGRHIKHVALGSNV